MRRKSIDEQLIEAEREDRVRDTAGRIVFKLNGIILILGETHPASEKLKEAIHLLSEII
jgi:hypothetical protein